MKSSRRQAPRRSVEPEADRERLLAGLRGVLNAVEELIKSPTVDALLWNAVEVARRDLGVERCGIFLVDGPVVRGTYGTNLRRETTDERSRVLDDARWHEIVPAVQKSASRWWVKSWPRGEWDGRSNVDLQEGWIAHTLIAQKGTAPIGVFCNDAAVTHAPADPVQQELLVIYCSFLADLIEQKRGEASLTQALERANVANHLKSQFLANVSHEVRTPLNSIIGFTEGILCENSVSRIHGHARTVLTEALKLLSIISSILDHARMESHSLNLKAVPFDLRQVMASVSSWAHGEAIEKGLEFSCVVPSNVPSFFMGDALRLHQILTNLIDNAIRFTQQGCVRLDVAAVESGTDRAKLRFEVTDTGIGIPKEKQEIIFESFSQADAEPRRKLGGLGLGLTIARQLVQLMGGEMGLQSVPDRGSSFWFTVTFDISPVPPAPADIILLPDGPQAPVRLPGLRGRILVAEDYKANQDIARLFLESIGHTVEVVDNGQKAVAACANTAFDLVILDIYMPTMDGYEAAQRIRAGQGTPCANRPLIALTARVDEETRQACRAAGFNSIIAKPLRRDSFLATVNAWISKSIEPAASWPTEWSDEDGVPSAATGGTGPIDYDRAVHEFGNNRALLNSVLENFLKTADTQIALMEVATEKKDADLLSAEAHRIRGAAASLTASAVAAAAENLENAARAGASADARQYVKVLGEELGRLKQFVSARTTKPVKEERKAT